MVNEGERRLSALYYTTYANTHSHTYTDSYSYFNGSCKILLVRVGGKVLLLNVSYVCFTNVGTFARLCIGSDRMQ